MDRTARCVHGFSQDQCSLCSDRLARRQRKPAVTRRETPDGYMEVLIDGRWVLEHRAVVAVYIGQPIPEGFVVHHHDRDRRNNRLSNLFLLHEQQHTHLHIVDDREWEQGYYLKDSAAHMDELRRRNAPTRTVRRPRNVRTSR